MTLTARQEDYADAYVSREITAAHQLHALLTTCIAGIQAIDSRLTFVLCGDKDEILKYLTDFLPPDDATIDHLISDEAIDAAREMV